jgi:hypothetical protein
MSGDSLLERPSRAFRTAGRVEIWRGGIRFSRNCVSDPFGLSVSEYLTISSESRRLYTGCPRAVSRPWRNSSAHGWITFLVDKGLLPPERARILRGWVHSGFNVHRARRVLSREREDMERLAQYIIRTRIYTAHQRLLAHSCSVSA